MATKIPIGKYIIGKLDDHNWTISAKHVIESGDNKGETVEKVKGYYPTLEILAMDMLNKLTADEVQQREIESYNGLIEIIKDSKDDIIKAIRESKNGND